MKNLILFSLIAGLVVSLVAIYVKGFRSTYCELGNVSGTNLYVDLSTHHRAEPISGMYIYRYIGPINFAFSISFKHSLNQVIKKKQSENAAVELKAKGGDKEHILITKLIIDLSGVSHMDMAGVKTCFEIKKETKFQNISLYMAGPNDRVFAEFKHAELLGLGSFEVLPSVHDAVLLAKSQHL